MSSNTPSKDKPYNLTLTEKVLEESIEALRKQPEWTDEPVIWLKPSEIRRLKKKHPEAFKRDFNCSWQQLNDWINYD